nr:type II toxin-antitoxin system VapC family toxin [uncultured Brevundimonas sp.]
MFYLDASVIVAAVTDEPHRTAVLQWLRANQDKLVVSSWTLTEVASALSIKVRDLRLTESDKDAGWRQVEAMRNTVLMQTVIEEPHFYAALRFVSQHQTGLRGGDALHIAVTADYDCALVTLDRRMAKGARLIGLAVVELPNPHQ